jgi:hypothetical protein
VARSALSGGPPRPKLADAQTFRSVGGRALAGGGGIAPDVVVAPDTLVGAERSLALRLSAAGGAAAPVLTRVAHRLAQGCDTSFVVLPGWREAFRVALADAGVVVPPAEWAAAGRYVSHVLEHRVADLAFGSREVGRRELARDRAFQVADSLLRAARSGGEVRHPG